MERLKPRQGLEAPEKYFDRMAQMKHKNLHGRVARKKSFLQPQYKIKHLKCAKENLENPEAFWNNLLALTNPK